MVLCESPLTASAAFTAAGAVAELLLHPVMLPKDAAILTSVPHARPRAMSDTRVRSGERFERRHDGDVRVAAVRCGST